MSVKIISDNSSDELRIDPNSKALRASLYNTDGNIISFDNVESVLNSSITPLGISGIFTGEWEDVSKFNSVNIGIYANSAGAANGVSIQFSIDGITTHFTTLYTYSSHTTYKNIVIPVYAKYFRIVYANGLTTNTIFNLKVQYSKEVLQSTFKISDSISTENDVQLIRVIPSLINSNKATSNLGITDSAGSVVSASTGSLATLSITPSAGNYVYLTELIISKFNTANLTASATPIVTSSTNLAGGLVVQFPANAGLQGEVIEKTIRPCTPIKSASAGTALTITCPATPNVIWRITAFYYIST